MCFGQNSFGEPVPGKIVLHIENADATPPHLEVFPAVGKLSGFAWICADLCGEQFRACALLDFDVLIIQEVSTVILLIRQSQTTFQCQDCHGTFSLI